MANKVANSKEEMPKEQWVSIKKILKSKRDKIDMGPLANRSQNGDNMFTSRLETLSQQVQNENEKKSYFQFYGNFV